MTKQVNLDDLKRLHGRARIAKAGARDWLEFATTMMDSFPALYETAKQLNAEMERAKATSAASAWGLLADLLAAINLHINVHDGLIAGEDIEAYVEAAASALGQAGYGAEDLLARRQRMLEDLQSHRERMGL
ncbi:MAG: hypothetical protein WC091_01235 [Sulfuricellaceae bacterium]